MALTTPDSFKMAMQQGGSMGGGGGGFPQSPMHPWWTPTGQNTGQLQNQMLQQQLMQGQQQHQQQMQMGQATNAMARANAEAAQHQAGLQGLALESAKRNDFNAEQNRIGSEWTFKEINRIGAEKRAVTAAAAAAKATGDQAALVAHSQKIQDLEAREAALLQVQVDSVAAMSGGQDRLRAARNRLLAQQQVTGASRKNAQSAVGRAFDGVLGHVEEMAITPGVGVDDRFGGQSWGRHLVESTVGTIPGRILNIALTPRPLASVDWGLGGKEYALGGRGAFSSDVAIMDTTGPLGFDTQFRAITRDDMLKGAKHTTQLASDFSDLLMGSLAGTGTDQQMMARIANSMGQAAAQYVQANYLKDGRGMKTATDQLTRMFDSIGREQDPTQRAAGFAALNHMYSALEAITQPHTSSGPIDPTTGQPTESLSFGAASTAAKLRSLADVTEGGVDSRRKAVLTGTANLMEVLGSMGDFVRGTMAGTGKVTTANSEQGLLSAIDAALSGTGGASNLRSSLYEVADDWGVYGDLAGELGARNQAGDQFEYTSGGDMEKLLAAEKALSGMAGQQKAISDEKALADVTLKRKQAESLEDLNTETMRARETEAQNLRTFVDYAATQGWELDPELIRIAQEHPEDVAKFVLSNRSMGGTGR